MALLSGDPFTVSSQGPGVPECFGQVKMPVFQSSLVLLPYGRPHHVTPKIKDLSICAKLELMKSETTLSITAYDTPVSSITYRHITVQQQLVFCAVGSSGAPVSLS